MKAPPGRTFGSMSMVDVAPNGTLWIAERCGANDCLPCIAAAAAMKQAGNDGPTDEPVSLEVQFLMERPKSHFNTKGDVKKASPLYPQSKPDLTKLLRCLEDALHGIVWKNDSQVCNQAQIKRYTGKGAQAIVTGIAAQAAQ